jgi:hypothetical protein
MDAIVNYRHETSPDSSSKETEPTRIDRLKINIQALNLFVVGALVLFFERAYIRWFAAYDVFLQFFTNVVLIASFPGMSCGCLARQRVCSSSSRA